MSLNRRSITIFIIGLVVLTLISYFGYRSYLIKKRDVHYAVFLTNGQVYFGKLAKSEGQVMILRDVYYLRTQEHLQSGESNKKKVSLIKLGDELHGPDDLMRINRDHVVFFEAMRTDSKINEAIKRHKAGAKEEVDSPSPTPAPSESSSSQ